MTIPMSSGGPPSSDTLWTTDGRTVFIDTGSTDAQVVMDRLLRVPVP